MKLSKSLNIINIISITLTYVLLLNKSIVFLYNDYIFIYLKFITIFIGISALISAIIEFKNENKITGILNVIIMFFTLPISFFRQSNYTFLFIPLIISIINLILLIKHTNNEKINIICIIAIIICTLVEIVLISIPISYSHHSINNFESALPQIQRLPTYKGNKKTDLEGFNLKIDNKRIRLQYKNINNKTIFTDTNGNELFTIKNLSGYGDTIDFINYIIFIDKYGITANWN